jgi:hypothetical protein
MKLARLTCENPEGCRQFAEYSGELMADGVTVVVVVVVLSVVMAHIVSLPKSVDPDTGDEEEVGER